MSAVLATLLGQIGLPGGGISFSHHYSSVGVSSSGAAMPGAFPLNIDAGRSPRHDNTDFKGYSAVTPIARDRRVDRARQGDRLQRWKGQTAALQDGDLQRRQPVASPTAAQPQINRRSTADQPQINRHEGYDHSYFFIASFIEQHLRFHAQYLRA